MSIKQISIDGDTLHIEIGEIEGKIISKTMPFFGPLLASMLSMYCRTILVMSSLERDKVTEMRERLSRGENIFSICEAVGINVNDVARQSYGEIEWPSTEEIDKLLGWSE